MKENTFHYLCNTYRDVPGNGFCRLWKMTLIVCARLLIKAFRAGSRGLSQPAREWARSVWRREEEDGKAITRNVLFIKASRFISLCRNARQCKMREAKLKGLHFPNWGFANVASTTKIKREKNAEIFVRWRDAGKRRLVFLFTTCGFAGMQLAVRDCAVTFRVNCLWWSAIN